ncbi:hypothetical protein BDBG_00327 [Blastomyces gilchristii SLH14081]|uniref:30S ribosomal protein S17 n=1 Tax=Blastomyces gilchristii (strain SLH14081) TaxID=559298 RepID=A0A179U6H5_BLAGS|nr:uncharacterized protein BDBG_00327 [Blastomyces gilchristii SLH14081]OAT03625.1 hypothetical protein BDBG_00327 [Blastomyces gilchristii SLH14081]
MTPKTILLRASARPSILIPSSRAAAPHPATCLSALLSAMQLRPNSRQIARRPLTTSTQSTQPTAQSSSSAASSTTPPPSPPSSSSSTPPPESQPTTNPTTPSARRTRHTLKFGTVLTAGRMDKTVRVLHKHTAYHKRLHKSYPASTIYLVHDPCNSLRQGDVIEFSSGWRTSKNVRHVVERIVAPFGEPVEQRPQVLSWAEREALKAEREEKAGKVMRVGRVKRLVAERLEIEKRRAEEKEVV